MSENIDFNRLVKYVEGQLTTEEMLEINAQIQSDPELKKTVEGLKAYLKTNNVDDLNAVDSRISDKIQRSLNKSKRKNTLSKFWLIPLLIIVFAIIFFLFLRSK